MSVRVALFTVLLAWPGTSVAGEPVDYLRDIRPILKERCYACHGALKQQARLRVDSGQLLRQGGRHGPAIQPGNPAASLLLERVNNTADSSRMPPEGKPLTEAQVRLLRTWIEQGAHVPDHDRPEEDARSHWAFQNPVRPSVPNAGDPNWSRNPIDSFLLAEHARHGLVASPSADKAMLLRRVYLDLIGLPPMREELHAFLANDSPDAYERVVDRLLASPQYGERWARHWMDVWRYSDWYGRRSVPDVMNSYARIFHWRDWIVRSLNVGKGYDRMVTEMLAADEICPEEDENVVATGFLVRNWFKWNYHQWMKDNVEHTAKAFLGLTINCCHCHDHKYDPITNEEYFRFRAIFEPLELRHDRVAGEADPGPFVKYVYGASYGPIQGGIVRVMDEKLDAKTFMYTRGEERNRIEDKPPVQPGVPAFLGGDRFRVEPVALPLAASYPSLKPFVVDEEIAKRQADVGAAAKAAAKARAILDTTALQVEEAEAHVWSMSGAMPPASADTLGNRQIAHEDALWVVRVAEAQTAAARSELAALQLRIAADRAQQIPAAADPAGLARQASKAERKAALDAAITRQVQADQALAKARRMPGVATTAEQQHAKAQQAVLSAEAALREDSTKYRTLGPVYPRRSTGRRSALARWITSSDNPLTARVAVNHLWRWHFGSPLVETTFDFGRNGKKPSHPMLLDWLAVELMDNGWQMKPLHRLIVTSAAYRMRSAVGDGPALNRERDPDNRLLWRFPVRRMEAEVVRDSLLHVAGDIDRSLGGVEIPHERGLSSRRRSLYFAYHGESKMEFLDLFDAANPCDCYQRATTVLPQQALALSNSDLTLQESRRLASKLAAEVNGTEAFVRAAFETILGRAPTPAESEASLAYMERHSQPTRGMANLVQALFNHNDFVTIR